MTNHRVYQELVYRNEVVKTMLTGFTTPRGPSFLYYFEAWVGLVR